MFFFPCALLVQRLLRAKADMWLEKELKRLDKFDALIIDDLVYVQQSREEMEVLFTFLAHRYEHRSVMLTSNLVFSKWENPMTTAAAIDRLVHHSIIFESESLQQPHGGSQEMSNAGCEGGRVMTNRNQAAEENTTGLIVDLKADRRSYTILRRRFFNKLSEGDLKKEKGPRRKKAFGGEACGTWPSHGNRQRWLRQLLLDDFHCNHQATGLRRAQSCGDRGAHFWCLGTGRGKTGQWGDHRPYVIKIRSALSPKA